MDLFKRMLVLTSFGFLPVTYGQIVTKKPEKVVEEDTVVRMRHVPTEGLDEFSFYAGAGRVFANRTLTENKDPYGEPVGLRADETGFQAWSFQLGMRNRFAHSWSYDVGGSIDRMGESYEYDDPDTDSTFSYTNRYTYFALPAQVFYTYGKDLRFFIGGGVQPQLLMGYRQEQEWTTSLQSTDRQDVKIEKGLNSFVFGVVASAGVQVRMGKSGSVYVLPAMLWNLTSTYDKQAEYIHKGYSFNLKFGLIFHIPQ